MSRFLDSIYKISEIVEKEVDILNEKGEILYSTNIHRKEAIIQENDCNKILIDENSKLYIYIKNGSMEELKLSKLIIQNIDIDLMVDDYQKLITNIMNGYIESEELYKKYNIFIDDFYIVYCIKLQLNENFEDTYSLLQNSFFDNADIKIFPYKEHIVILEHSKDNITYNTKEYVRMILDMINSEIYTPVYIGIGNAYKNIKNIRKSYEEAVQAIENGRIYNIPHNIYIYREILAERIISLIPKEKIQSLIAGIIDEEFDNIYDDEIIKTINAMFDNNLNISDSSKILYIHRNTLLYRIEKIQKITGLDIRKFQDSVILRLALLLRSRK